MKKVIYLVFTLVIFFNLIFVSDTFAFYSCEEKATDLVKIQSEIDVLKAQKITLENALTNLKNWVAIQVDKRANEKSAAKNLEGKGSARYKDEIAEYQKKIDDTQYKINALQASYSMLNQTPCCTDTSWTPEPSTIAWGELFTQVSNCGNERTSEYGTKDAVSGIIKLISVIDYEKTLVVSWVNYYIYTAYDVTSTYWPKCDGNTSCTIKTNTSGLFVHWRSDQSGYSHTEIKYLCGSTYKETSIATIYTYGYPTIFDVSTTLSCQ